MENDHSNKTKSTQGSVANPSPADIKAAREAANLTQEQAAALIYRTPRNWQQWEGGERRMDPALWELFNLNRRHQVHNMIAIKGTIISEPHIVESSLSSLMELRLDHGTVGEMTETRFFIDKDVPFKDLCREGKYVAIKAELVKNLYYDKPVAVITELYEAMPYREPHDKYNELYYARIDLACINELFTNTLSQVGHLSVIEDVRKAQLEFLIDHYGQIRSHFSSLLYEFSVEAGTTEHAARHLIKGIYFYLLNNQCLDTFLSQPDSRYILFCSLGSESERHPLYSHDAILKEFENLYQQHEMQKKAQSKIGRGETGK